MKNQIKKCLVIALLFTTIVTTARDGEIDVRVRVINTKIINITLQNSDGDVEVSIIDNKGIKLYKEKFQGLIFNKKFDLSTLPNGNYFIEIEGQTRIKLMQFSVALSSVEFNSESEIVYYKPVVRIENDKVLISKKATDNDESLEIELFDEKSNLLYTEELIGSITLNRKLDISKLIGGEYQLLLKSGNRIFEKSLKKKN